jgi:hypothetical protein
LILGAGVGVFAWRIFGSERFGLPEAHEAAVQLALSAVLIGLGSTLLTRKLARGWTWLFGWRAPAGEDWWLLVPLVVIGGGLGGAWIPHQVAAGRGALAAALGAVVLMAIALELCFRGLMHGLLILDYRVQSVKGRWFLSRPALASGVLYALMTLLVTHVWIAPLPEAMLSAPARQGWTAAGALLAGLALGMIRERSLSVWPGAAALAVGSGARLLLELWQIL